MINLKHAKKLDKLNTFGKGHWVYFPKKDYTISSEIFNRNVEVLKKNFKKI